MLQSEIDGHPRPQMPKRKVVKPLKAGRSFDIVHPNSRPRKLAPKKIAPAQPDSADMPAEKEILEKDTIQEAPVTQPSPEKIVKVAEQPIVLDDDSTKVSTDEEDDAEKITLTSESEVLQEIKDDADTPASNAVEQPDASSDKVEDTTKANESDASGRVYANNLVQSSNPTGYKPRKTQPALAVFDAEDYHGELHDWSHLGDRRGRQWLFLGVLLTILLLLLVTTIFRPSFLPAWLHIPIF